MNPEALFARLAELIPKEIDRVFPGYQGCILATRVAVEIGEHFGVPVLPYPTQMIVYNAQYAARIERGDPADIQRWFAEDGSHSVGVGFGQQQPGGWNGHLIALAPGIFGDFAIGQVERPALGIITGAALVGPWSGAITWKAVNQTGTTVEYKRLASFLDYRSAPDWTDEKRRKKICGPIIRALKV